MLNAILSLALLILFAKGTGKISEMLEQPIVLGQIRGDRRWPHTVGVGGK